MKKNRLKIMSAVVVLCLACAVGGCSGNDEVAKSDFTEYPDFLSTAQDPSNETDTAAGGETAEGDETAQSGEDSTYPEFEGHTFETVSDLVHATTDVNVRTEPSVDGDIIGVLRMHQTAERTGIGDQGWDRITFEGGTGYVNGAYLEEGEGAIPLEDSGEEETEEETETSESEAEETQETEEETTAAEEEFEETEETVYATEPVNVYSGPGTSYDVIDALGTGMSVTRTGIGSQGWDRIEYEGQTGYVASGSLTTSNPDSAADENQEASAGQETVYAVSPVNVRAGNNTSSAVLGQLAGGEAVTRIEKGADGWDRVLYNGQEGYVSSSYLTTEQP